MPPGFAPRVAKPFSQGGTTRRVSNSAAAADTRAADRAVRIEADKQKREAELKKEAARLRRLELQRQRLHKQAEEAKRKRREAIKEMTKLSDEKRRADKFRKKDKDPLWNEGEETGIVRAERERAIAAARKKFADATAERRDVRKRVRKFDASSDGREVSAERARKGGKGKGEDARAEQGPNAKQQRQLPGEVESDMPGHRKVVDPANGEVRYFKSDQADTIWTKDELRSGAGEDGSNLTGDPQADNAMYIDPENPDGFIFVDRSGRTRKDYATVNGKQIKAGTRDKWGRKIEGDPYTWDDWNAGVHGDEAMGQLGLHVVNGRGAVLTDDEGETWLQAPKPGAYGLPEGGKKIKGSWKTTMGQLTEWAGLEKADPERLKEFQNRLFQGDFMKGVHPDSDKYAATGVWDTTTDQAAREFLNRAITMSAMTGKDINDVLDDEIAMVQAQIAANPSGGGGGGGGGGASSYSATDPVALSLYAEQAARAVLGRVPTEAERASAVAKVQAAEAAAGGQQSGGIVNVDPQAQMVDIFRAAQPAEYQAKNLADTMGLFSKMIGEGGLLGTGMGASKISMGNGGS